MPLAVVIAFTLLILIALGAHWLFRQRTPEEMRKAHERLKDLRKRQDT